ncbi:MAG TPA: hypothetical protein VK654_05585, partial [Nitrospirota bacterium]|nr:hypothetical protein [Nitrospirota bacterium]
IVLGSLFLLQQFEKVLLEEQRLISAFLYYAIRIVALYLFFFSIYTYLARISNLRKLESPVFFIIFGAIFVLMSYGPPIAAYSVSRDHDVDVARHHMDETVVKNAAMDVKYLPDARYKIVRIYYLETGKLLAYLDNNNQEVIFSPDGTTLHRYNESLETVRKLKSAVLNLKITAFSLIGILTASTVCFAVFLWYRFPHKTNNLIDNEN